MEYVRVCNGLSDKGKLVPSTELYEHILDQNKDWYKSLYYYNDLHFKSFKELGSVAGIIDVVSGNLAWDFDSDDLEEARAQTQELCARLLAHGLTPDMFTICFSGNKGFSVEIKTTSRLSPSEFKNITSNLAKGLSARDSKIINPSRIFRMASTRHPKSGLFKLCLTLTQLSELSTDMIKKLAQDHTNTLPEAWNLDKEVVLPELVLKLAKEEVTDQVKPIAELGELDLSAKPKNIPHCKWAILNGFFKEGNRHHCLMALGAHLKSQGFPKEVVYRMLKGAVELQETRFPTKNPIDKKQIWDTIINSIYNASWQGKNYSCKDHDFLKEVCPVLNTPKCSITKKEKVVSIDHVSNVFLDYAANIDANTVLTGIPLLDKKCRLQTKTHSVIAGCSGSGKTTLILNILKNISARGQKAVFGSLDMSDAVLYQKIAQQISGLNDDALYRLYKTHDPKIKDINAEIAKAYKNVMFDFRSGQNIEEIRENLLALKEKHGDELKLAVYDFINLIGGPYSDETANLAYIAPKLKDLANEAGVLIISLAQVARAKGGPATPFKDHRIAKGSSAIEESATVVLGVWREGYNTPNDNYMTVAGLKMRMGREFKLDLHWSGATSEIRELTAAEDIDLEEFRAAKEAEEEGSSGGWGRKKPSWD